MGLWSGFGIFIFHGSLWNPRNNLLGTQGSEIRMDSNVFVAVLHEKAYESHTW